MGGLLGGDETVIWTKEGRLANLDRIEVRKPGRRKSEENERPSPISPTLREKLSIFGKEDSVKSPVVISFDQQNSYSKYMLPVSMEFEELHEMKNYDMIPLGVLHHMFLFLRPKDLVKLFTTCKYFNKAGMSNMFWKMYYLHFFDLDPKEHGIMVDLNYKKQFFKRFSDCRCADQYYRSVQKPIILTEENEEECKERGFVLDRNQRRFVVNSEDYGELSYYTNETNNRYIICGPHGTGKRSLLHRLWKNEFDTDAENGYPKNKLTGNSTFHFTYIKPWKRSLKRVRLIGGQKKMNSVSGYSAELFLLMNEYEQSMKRIEIVTDPIKDISSHCGGRARSVLFCFVAGDRKSFEEIKKFVVEYSTSLGSEVPKRQRRRGILVGLKSDLKRREVKEKEIKNLVGKYLLKGYIECSAKENTNCYLPLGVLVSKKTWRVMRVGGRTAL